MPGVWFAEEELVKKTKSEARSQKLEARSPESGKRIAVYPGSFDPITLGHLDVVKRAVHLFDKVVVGVASRQEKHPLFSWAERIRLAKEVVKGMDGVRDSIACWWSSLRGSTRKPSSAGCGPSWTSTTNSRWR